MGNDFLVGMITTEDALIVETALECELARLRKLNATNYTKDREELIELIERTYAKFSVMLNKVKEKCSNKREQTKGMIT